MGKTQGISAFQVLQSEGLLPAVEGSIRGTCPFCGGRNTISVTNTGNEYIWYCFRASCNTSGKKSITERSVSVLRNSLKDTGRIIDHSPSAPTSFVLPGSFNAAINVERAVHYLRQNHCLRAMVDGRVEILYDTAQDRVVFLVKQGDTTYDAVGRALTNATMPKWLRYGSSHLGFTVAHRAGSRTEACLVVEDCASACAASCIMDTFALLGTSFPSEYIKQLRAYRNVVIALDPDAMRKSINLHRRLSWYMSPKVWLIPNDLKYYGPLELMELARGSGII